MGMRSSHRPRRCSQPKKAMLPRRAKLNGRQSGSRARRSRAGRFGLQLGWADGSQATDHLIDDVRLHGTVQGIELTDKPAYSFQGHPEASPGPHDVAGLFDRFIGLMEPHRR